MKKTPKKIVIFIVALAAVIILGALAMLLLDGGPGTTSPPPPPPQTPPDTGTAAPSASQPPADTGTIETEKTAEGAIHTVTVPGGLVTYSVTVSDDAAVLEGTPEDLLLTSAADTADFINITFAPGVGAVQLAPRIPDRYLKYNEFEQSGLNNIPGTDIAGETVAAGDGNTVVKAWLVNTGGGVLSVVLRTDAADTPEETAVLYDILKTIKIS